MNDRNAERHIPDGELLLYLDGELGRRATAAIRRHLEECWECRARYDGLHRRACAFSNLRQQALPDQLPSPEQSLTFLRRLRAETQSAPVPSFPWRAAWITGGLSTAAAALLLIFSLTRPPSITAAEFFSRVERSSLRPAQRSFVQRVRLRQGTRSLEHDVRHGLHGASAAPPAREWREALEAAAVDWNDPLNAGAFIRWHEQQRGAEDRVQEDGESVMLVSQLPRANPVRSAALVVRRADWRPVGKRFEFDGQPPLEIAEVRLEAAPPEAVEAALPPPAVADPLPAPDIDGPDLEQAEISARECLHALGADLAEAPEFTRAGTQVVVSAVIDSEERRRTLTAALASLAGVRAEFRPPATQTEGEWEVLPAPVHTSEPPFGRSLWNLMGGMDEANRYLELIRARYGRTRSRIMALERLAARYDAASSAGLPAGIRTRVHRLAAGLGEQIRADGHEYLLLIAAPVNRLLEQTGARVPDAALAEPPLDWRSIPLAQHLEQTQSSFRRMFLVEQLAGEAPETGPQLIQRHLDSRRRLQADLESLGRPETAP